MKNLVGKTLLTSLAVISGANAAYASRRRAHNRALRAHLPDRRVVELSDGYRVECAARIADVSAPTILFENGLGEGFEAWDWVRMFLSPNQNFLSYNRAGYGKTTPQRRQGLVPELLGELKVTGEVYCVAHSIGSLEIARSSYQESLTDWGVRGAVFVDGTDPEAFCRLASSAQTSDRVLQTMDLKLISSIFGTNMLASDLEFEVDYRASVQRDYISFCEDTRTAIAAKNELAYLQRVWKNLPPSGVPQGLGTVVAAQNSPSGRDAHSSEQRNLQQFLGTSKIVQVAGAGHRSILGVAQYAAIVAQVISEGLK